jgi:hypothetical protein
MWRTLILISLVLCVGCTTRVQHDYFEPSGLGVTISSPPEAPKNTATLQIQGSAFSIGSHVTDAGEIEISMRVEVPSGKTLRFQGLAAEVTIGNAQEKIPLNWIQWKVVDGIGGTAEFLFDAPLPGQTFHGRPPKSGLQLLGRYDCKFHLPASYADARQFSVILPAPEGTDQPLAVRFVRKAAEYRMYVQLQ